MRSFPSKSINPKSSLWIGQGTATDEVLHVGVGNNCHLGGPFLEKDPHSMG